jgi:cardiolipin synthase
MIPDKPDHPFVHWVSLSYLCELLPAGVRGYLYGSGFIHAKTVVVDGRIASIGSANWDVRSFELNFETNAVLYSNEVAGMQKASFLDDLSLCRELTKEDCDRRPLLVRFRMFVSRLFSDIL